MAKTMQYRLNEELSAPQPTSDSAFTDLVRMAAQVCQTPIALLWVTAGDQPPLCTIVGLATTELPRFQSLLQQAMQQTAPLVVRDILVDPRFAIAPLVTQTPRIRFYAGVPLINLTGGVMGTLSVIDYLPRELTPAQLDLLSALGRQVVKLMELETNTTVLNQMTAELQERSAIASLSAAIASALGQGGDLTEILDHCLAEITTRLQIPFARIWTYKQETHLLELQAISGQHSHTPEFGGSIPLGISIVGFIAQTLQPYLTNDVATDMVIGAREWVQAEAMVAFAGYPLVTEDRLVGVLALFNREPFTETVQAMLASLSDSLAIAIDRAWAREELLSSREALLFRLASQIRNSLDLDTILGNAVHEIRSLLNIDRCHFIWCWSSPDSLVLAVTHESKLDELPSLLGECLPEQVEALGAVILDQVMIRSNDVPMDANLEPKIQQTLLAMDITSQVLLPLETHSGQLGAIVCSHCSGTRNWSDSEVELLQAVVTQLALAMDHAELYAQTRAAASAAQSQAKQLGEAIQNLKQTQSQLIQSEKMSSLGQMVAGIAHEINNPVNFISGNLVYAGNYIQDVLELMELYQKYYPEPVPEVQQRAEEIDMDFIAEDLPKLLSSMMMGAERIRQIVLSLRNFSRLDEAEMKPVDIHEGIDNTLLILQSRLKPTTHHTGIQVVKEYGELPAVDCYAGQLNQVFMNVLANAIDAIDGQEGPRIITISTTVVSKENGAIAGIDLAHIPHLATKVSVPSVLIRIRDNGPGMNESVRQHLFDPFFTTKPVGKGTGLGLSISYQIVVEKHGGSLECVSEPGQGAEFQILIPIKPPTRIRLEERVISL